MEAARSHLAPARSRRLLVLAGLSLVVAGASAIASPMAQRVVQAQGATAGAESSARILPGARAERLVWQGADVDGDGQADFANPTGQDTRKTDAYGCGDFGASRDGGERRHEGVDFKADAGQALVAPLSGYVTKIGYAYPGDQALKFVEISNPALRYQARVFYIDPTVEVGQTVRVGQPIGAHQTLEQKYPGGMTDHVHLEIMDTRGERIDATHLITARLAPSAAPARG